MLKLITKIKPKPSLLYDVKLIHHKQPAPVEPEVGATTSFGQPTHSTHPHLFTGSDQITPLITRDEYQQRRERLHSLISTQNDGKNIIIIPSATKQYMSDKIPYVFRQNTDFLYLTGCQEPDSCLILESGTNRTSPPVSTLFVRDSNEEAERWDGPRTGPGNAVRLFGVDRSLPTTDLVPYLASFLKKTTDNHALNFWYDPEGARTQPNLHENFEKLSNFECNKHWTSPRLSIHKLRVYKSDAEIELMQRSCTLASKAFTSTIKHAKPGCSEHEIFAKIDYECRRNGAEFLAYPPVVAAGNRANIIHYINNNQLTKNGELVLMDAGCEYHGYASDITRTWPINGVFSGAQRELYEVILRLQTELIALLANSPSLDALFNAMCMRLGKYLQEIGVLDKTLSGRQLFEAAFRLCPHHVSHYLGMDVHDTPLIPRTVRVQPGMVVTVEPGIYIGANDRHVKRPEFRGIGIRIEDDVLICGGDQNGPIVLSRDCPKSVDDLQRIFI